jgi:hypothetical protein
MPDATPNDWATLSDEWRAAPVTLPLDVMRQRVRAGTRRMIALLVGELAITMAAAAALASAARVATTWREWSVVVGLTVFSVIIWVFTHRNRRGIWSAASESLADYQQLERERWRRRVAAARFTWQISLVGVPALTLLLVSNLMRGPATWTAELVDVSATVYLAACGVFGRWRERRLRVDGEPSD